MHSAGLGVIRRHGHESEPQVELQPAVDLQRLHPRQLQLQGWSPFPNYVWIRSSSAVSNASCSQSRRTLTPRRVRVLKLRTLQPRTTSLPRNAFKRTSRSDGPCSGLGALVAKHPRPDERSLTRSPAWPLLTALPTETNDADDVHE